MPEQWEEKLAQVLQTTHPATEPRAGWETQAVSAMERARPLGKPRRRVAVCALAVVALIGLGFVPIPAGKAKGVLARALAAAEGVTTVHVTEFTASGNSRLESDSWYSADGFEHRETRQDGELVEVSVQEGPWRRRWTYTDPQHHKPVAWESFSPIAPPPTNVRWMAQQDRSGILSLYERLQTEPRISVSLREWQEYSLWGGRVDMAEIEGTVKADVSLESGQYAAGVRVRWTAEIDPATKRLISVRHYGWQDGWQLFSEQRYEWDVEIAPELHDFRAPEGAEMHRDTR